jgi:hypothetical protein
MKVNSNEAVSKACQPEFIEGDQFDCQDFDKFNMTIKLTFETASFFKQCIFLLSSPFFQSNEYEHLLRFGPTLKRTGHYRLFFNQRFSVAESSIIFYHL